jgi:hypothetical protein
MGLRFRRSIRIAPGLRLNVGLKSASVSIGRRGINYTAGTAGRRFTVGAPGTGLFWTTKVNKLPGWFLPISLSVLIIGAALFGTSFLLQ